ncbi:PAS domain-containing protein [Babesia caballi]|uniref:PAS domain-containing protein n=1 Tax=Babesia caballi TaxID=5871 RepID=A0AAV4LW52_BABCB|nr:PAS domain-containing protein [Babesia caballi]
MTLLPPAEAALLILANMIRPKLSVVGKVATAAQSSRGHLLGEHLVLLHVVPGLLQELVEQLVLRDERVKVELLELRLEEALDVTANLRNPGVGLVVLEAVVEDELAVVDKFLRIGVGVALYLAFDAGVRYGILDDVKVVRAVLLFRVDRTLEDVAPLLLGHHGEQVEADLVPLLHQRVAKRCQGSERSALVPSRKLREAQFKLTDLHKRSVDPQTGVIVKGAVLQTVLLLPRAVLGHDGHPGLGEVAGGRAVEQPLDVDAVAERALVDDFVLVLQLGERHGLPALGVLQIVVDAVLQQNLDRLQTAVPGSVKEAVLLVGVHEVHVGVACDKCLQSLVVALPGSVEKACLAEPVLVIRVAAVLREELAVPAPPVARGVEEGGLAHEVNVVRIDQLVLDDKQPRDFAGVILRLARQLAQGSDSCVGLDEALPLGGVLVGLEQLGVALQVGRRKL